MNALGKSGIRALAAKIRELDPEGKYVALNPDENTVEYSVDIECSEQISGYVGEEEPCRAFVVAWLCTLGGYLPGNLSLERRYSIGRPKTGAELDILVLHPKGTAFALIEIKSSSEYEIDQDKYIEGQLFNIAPHEPGAEALSYATVVVRGNDPEIVCKTIDYAAYPTFKQWKESRACATTLPANYGQPVHVHLTKDGDRDLNRDVSLADLRRIQRRLHDVLWRGSTPDNTIYDQVIKLFLAKSHDEKTTRSGDDYRFQIRYPGNQREDPEQTFNAVSSLYKDAYRKYLNLPKNAEVEGLNVSDFSYEQTAFVVELIQDISLVQAASNADILGSFFEGITREGFKQTKGLFFTHGNIVAFIIHVLNLASLATHKIQSDSLASEKLPYIIDPSCGSGTFLLGAMSHITDFVAQNRSDLSVNEDTRNFINQQFLAEQENAWAGTFLYGLDASQTLAISTKVNMLLRQDGQAHIYNADGLAPLSSFPDAKLRGRPHAETRLYSKNVAETFDVVISNPPFSITLDPQTARSLEDTFELAGSSNSENLFLERWYQLLRPGGRLGVVLPESFFSTRENLSARLFLFSHFNVKAVVSLPKEAFEPWTPTRTSLLFAEKKTVDEERGWIDRSVRYESRANIAKAAGLRAIRAIIRNAKNLSAPEWRERATAIADELAGTVQLSAVPETFSSFDLERFLTDWMSMLEGAGKSAEIRKAKTFVRAAIKRLLDTPENWDKVKRAFQFFELDGFDASAIKKSFPELLPEIESLLAILNKVDVRVWAFHQVAEKSDATFFTAAADSIGYRRTKRGESERPNDLFSAFSEGDQANRVFDLDLSTSAWRMRIASDQDDLLSQLRDVVQWSSAS